MDCRIVHEWTKANYRLNAGCTQEVIAIRGSGAPSARLRDTALAGIKIHQSVFNIAIEILICFALMWLLLALRKHYLPWDLGLTIESFLGLCIVYFSFGVAKYCRMRLDKKETGE